MRKVGQILLAATIVSALLSPVAIGLAKAEPEVKLAQAPVPLTETARLATELAGASPDLVQELDPPPGRVTPRITTDRLRALGWRQQVGLQEGLRLTLESLTAAAPL